MRPISSWTYEALMVAGIANGLAGTRDVHEMKSPGAAMDRALGEVKTDDPMREGTRRRPTAGQEEDAQPMRMEMAGAETPASALERQEREPSPVARPVALQIVASNTLKRSRKCGRLSLVLS